MNRHFKYAAACLIVLLVTGGHALAFAGEPAERPTATIEGQPDQSFASLQAALDDAPTRATIHLSAGRLTERVTIKKPVTLIGAGQDKTILGPTLEDQVALREKLERLARELDDMSRALEAGPGRREASDEEIAEGRRRFEEAKQLDAEYSQAPVTIEGVADVTLKSLRVTMLDTPQEKSGNRVCGAVTVKEASVTLADCAIVGCISSGVEFEGKTSIKLDDCLVAACWGSGISMKYVEGSRLTLTRCDIRNNYHYNVGAGADDCVIENCRISGTAWSGISNGGHRVRIEGNAIFNNAGGGIYSAGPEGVVQRNLFYNNGSGASCWSDEHPTIVNNVFLKNASGAIFVNGASDPVVKKNLIVDSPKGVRYGPMRMAHSTETTAVDVQVLDNVFWKVDTPLALALSNESGAERPIPLSPDEKNRIVDPHAAVDGQQALVIADRAIVDDLELASLLGLSLESRWPITPEETAMIPDDGTRDSPKWKMRPK